MRLLARMCKGQWAEAGVGTLGKRCQSCVGILALVQKYCQWAESGVGTLGKRCQSCVGILALVQKYCQKRYASPEVLNPLKETHS
jgi:hypothetical protein